MEMESDDVVLPPNFGKVDGSLFDMRMPWEYQWVDSKKELPDKGRQVLVCCVLKDGKKILHIARRTGNSWFYAHHDSMEKVVKEVSHWGLLPNIP